VYISSSDGFATAANSTETVVKNFADNTVLDFRLSGDGSTFYYQAVPSNIYSLTISSGTTTQLTSGESNTTPDPVGASYTMKQFTVLGDSFSSGEGNPPFDSGTDTSTDKCHRSSTAYANVLNSHPLGITLDSFVACSGATSSDVINGKYGEGAQLTHISTTDKYIILTVGGNDVQFNQFATNCVTGNCDGSSQYTTTDGLIQNTLPDNLDTLFSDIKNDVGSNTRVLVLGYPYILPLSSQTGINCTYLTSGERTAATNVQVDLNGAINSAVTRAGSQFEFVDPNATGGPFDGHQLCSSGTYFNGLDVTHTEYSFHPNADGQAAYEQVVADSMPCSSA
jgi:lysophospholipase L1-like esterase